MLTGVTQGVTLDLFWTEETIQVQVGDTVSWLLADSIHDLQEIQSVQLLLESTSADVTSATLTRGDSSGTFSYTFNQVGDFTLTGFSIPQSFGVPSVVVNVTGPRASFDEVEVFVGGYRAEYVSSGINKREADMSACGPSAPEEIETGSSPAISYTPCLTPVVSYVEPKMGFRFETVFTIRGSRFGDVNSLNEVSFGGHPCTVLSSNESTIECIMNEASGLPSVYSDLPIILRVVDLGNAYVVSEEDSTIQLQPFISGIDPPFGSVEGGTDVIVYGDGFPQMDVDAATEIVVDLNGLTCSVYAGNYTEVRCTTPASPDGTMQSVVKVELSMQIVACINPTGCNFTYSDDHTPKVESVYPTSINSTDPTLITLQGTGFGEDLASNIVKFGDFNCTVTEANDSSIVCVLPPLPATTYPLSLQVCNLSDNRCYGNAQILSESDTTITSVPEVISISPQNGSVQGDTKVTISGRGFNTNPDDVQVLIGTVECFVTYINYSTIICLTSPNTEGMYSVQVSITGLSAFPATAQYSYSIDNTPCITGISPSSGNIGDTITLTGTLLESTADLVDVQFGEANCNVLSATESEITCSPESNFVGSYIPDVTISGMGKALIENVQFNFTLNIDSVSPTAGSFAGLNPILLEGSGFYPGDILITVCGVSCPLSSSTPSVSQVECIAPPMVESSSMVNCDVLVETLGEVFIIPAAYTYRGDLTPRVETVNRTRGGTAGGSILLITGMGFTGTASVTIAGSVCDVQSQTATEIVCVTGASGRNVQSTIMVEIDGMGYAISDVEFWYVDLWSSPFTWQDGIIPTAGDFVVVPKGQTLVLDVVTPVLAYILIQGGSLIFDQEKGDNEVELHTQGGLITCDGVFQVGTEQEPFLSKTQIVLYGHVLSTEIPVYGAKTLALRRGTLDIHGRQLNVTWTKLAMTAAAGSSMLHLQKYVDWDVGGSVVIASTSFSQRENEERIIQSISAGSEGSILTLTEPLDYEHISVQQTIDGRFIDTSGEVGYLTRNVVIRGNVNEDWLEEAPSCPENFRPGQFEVQTCFLGRFGAESLSDQFGSQVMIHASEQNEGHVTARFGYVEVTHAGQAFRLGRYPIHYHLNGNVSGSYVRGCGIHHTFNRAVTVHAVDYLLIENNVAFNILGHAYFLEDGIEEHNIIQDNLGVFVRASSSLLNVDITPATFWIVNPNNIVRRNAAAGGTHFGFWYRLPEHPTGPSATTSVNPRQLPVEEFSDNTAHSFGWYGLWVYQAYHPSQTVYYDRFTAWRCDRGVEFTEVGSLQLRDSVMLDNRFAGVEVVDISAVWAGDDEDGPLIKDTLIVGYSDISASDFCTESGIKTPHSYYLTVSGVTFANFNRPDCYPIQACSHCKMFQGGFETRYKGISYINEGEDITRWQWSHEHIHRDLDGTLTKTDTPSLLIPSSELLSPTECQPHTASSDGVDGVICDFGLTFGRLAVYNPIPTSLQFTNLNISNEFGTDEQPYIEKRLRGGAGQMAILVLNETYQLTWVEGTTFTNISYSTLISGFAEDDYVLFTQSYPRSLDYTNIRGVTTASNVSALENPANAVTGDFYITDNTSLTYIVKGPEELNGEPELQFSTYRCFYENCIPPPPPTLPPPRPEGRPDVVQSWSNSSIWPDNQLPQAGADVYINSSMYVLVDMPLPRLGTLTIAGAVELLDSIDHQIEADFIIVDGGRLAIGYPDTPFQHKAKIVLHGNQTSKQISRRLKRNFGTNIGAKALAVFGELIMHGVSRQPTWTTLAQTAMAGANMIVVEDTVTWVPGDVIVITSTSYDAFETEVFEISSVDSNSNTITLNSTLVNAHSGGDFDSLGVGNRYTTRAEVGLLSRNIVITNDDNSLANSEAFGCRVLVTHNDLFTGAAQIEGVEFSGCGQLGYTEEFDPRFALALLNIEDSYVRSCSFHDGYNTAIGVFASFSVSLADNVIHNTVGPSIVASGSEHSITHNLASLAQFIGTYRNRDEPSNDLWTANFEVIDVASLTLVGNAAAGGAKAGYHTNGEDCASSSSTTMIRDNTAHSSLHGVHLGYTDGNPSGCSRLANFNIFNCFHYGIFSYSLAGLEVVDTVLTNNKAAVYVSVIGPASLSHVRGVKSVLFERVLVVSSGEEFTCEEDSKRPAIADHKTSHFGLRSPTNGHLGFLIPSFLSGPGHFPKFPWHTIISYPAINGLTEMKQVTFANFHEQCPGKVDTVLMTSPLSEDANHPVHMSDITFVSDNRFESSVTSDAKLFVHRPNLGRVNPSDCVDMECDGHKQVLLKDAAGTFTQSVDGEDRTIISEAEFEWDGDPRRGLGDYRIPRTMLTYPNGSRIDISSIYPKKGIIRGVSDFADEQDCLFNSAWNMYECKSVDHLMLVLESLDADTEVRRLSPIGLGANGFISLLNGPMDNGWCGGYTCQERISTFFGIVGSGVQYTVGLTSTNPQNFAMYLLNADSTQGIVVGIIYTNPQRLDVYHDGVYVLPTNAERDENMNIKYLPADPNIQNQFIPVLSDEPGSNFFDRGTKQLYINVKGDATYRIETKPVVVLSLTLQVSVDDFFDEVNLIRNLALLLEIPENKIRVVSVSRETVSRRKRADDGGSVMQTIELEFGDPPDETLTEEPVDTGNTTGSGMNMTDSSGGQNATDVLSIEDLEDISERVVEVTQTGEISQALNSTANVTSASIEEPVPPPVDETGGVRATPDTGGPQPEEFGDNSTAPPTFSEIQMMEEEAELNMTDEIVFSIPTMLDITYEPSANERILEGIALQDYAPVIVMLDNNGEVVVNLGLDIPWVLTAQIVSGPDGSFTTEASTNFTQGQAVLSSLVFSHPGEYILTYSVTFPASADFGVTSSLTMTVLPRDLQLLVTQEPTGGNTTFILFPYPRVSLVDLVSEESIEEHAWRNSTWFIIASVTSVPGSNLIGRTEIELVNGQATFTDIQISSPGEYWIEFEAYTIPTAMMSHLPVKVSTRQFTIRELPITKLDVIYNVDFNSTVGGNEEAFIDEFSVQFYIAYPSIEIINITLTEGSIIVSVIVTASNPQQLVDLASHATSGLNFQSLSFTFNSTSLTPSNVTQDSAYLVFVPTLPPSIIQQHLVLILATVIPGGAILIVLCVLAIICCVVYKHKSRKRVFKIKVREQCHFITRNQMSCITLL